MGWLAKIFGKPKPVQPYPAEPSTEQVFKAKAILGFANSEAWKSYEVHLERDFESNLVKCFDAVEKGQFNTLPLFVMQAKVGFDRFKEIEWAKSIMGKLSKSKQSTTR